MSLLYFTCIKTVLVIRYLVSVTCNCPIPKISSWKWSFYSMLSCKSNNWNTALDAQLEPDSQACRTLLKQREATRAVMLSIRILTVCLDETSTTATWKKQTILSNLKIITRALWWGGINISETKISTNPHKWIWMRIWRLYNPFSYAKWIGCSRDLNLKPCDSKKQPL